MKASVDSLFLFLGECTPVCFSKGTLSQALGQSSDPGRIDSSTCSDVRFLVVHDQLDSSVRGKATTFKLLNRKRTLRHDRIHLKQQPM